MDFDDCPIKNYTQTYLMTVEDNYKKGKFDTNLLPKECGFSNPEEAYNIINTKGHLLKSDTLLHGDYCLPNIILNDWKFSGFVDLSNAGVGDRHIDIFWAIWTLNFNLKTDKYRKRFIEAYGKDKIDDEKLLIVASAEVFN
jgi:kanamycin kinase